MMPSNLKLHKSEKLCSSTAIDALFARKGKGALAFPVRMVVAKGERSHGAQVQFLISVPKKRLRHAVDRVTMRRRIRESFRLNRHLLPELPEGMTVNVAFIYVASQLVPYHKVEKAICRLLPQITVETVAAEMNDGSKKI